MATSHNPFKVNGLGFFLPVFLVSMLLISTAAFAVVEVDTFTHSTCRVELIMPDASRHILDLAGPSVMEVWFEGPSEGIAIDNNGNGLDEVETQLTAMNLGGYHSLLGIARVSLNPQAASMGQMEEVLNNTPGILDIPPFISSGPVDSFFDVYIEIDLPDIGVKLYNQVPMRCISIITHKPPEAGNIYHAQGPFVLYDQNGDHSGVLIDELFYHPNPVVEIDPFNHSNGQIELTTPAGSAETIPLSGSSTVEVFFEGTVEGSAYDHDGDSLDEVHTEMAALNLSGTSPIYGTVHMRLDTTRPSAGQMEETTDLNTGTLDVPPFTSTATVDSFFDVFFELDLPSMGMTFYIANPMRWTSLLHHKPPGPNDTYSSFQPIPLLDSAGNPTGFTLTEASLLAAPCVRCSDFDTSGTTDLPDLVQFADNWMWKETVGDTDNPSDLNCDWQVNLSDFANFAANWMDACL